MASLAKPDTPVPLFIALIDVDDGRAALEKERGELFAPYQDEIERRLREQGVEEVSRFWISNAMTATVPARLIDEILCWPYVRMLQSEKGFWEVAEPPWGDEEAGPRECPMLDGACPEHCFAVKGTVYEGELGEGCFVAEPLPRAVVACSRQDFFVSDSDHVCRLDERTGRAVLFTVEPTPTAPDFLGWSDCADLEIVRCGD